jgi:hypothetical protein
MTEFKEVKVLIGKSVTWLSYYKSKFIKFFVIKVWLPDNDALIKVKSVNISLLMFNEVNFKVFWIFTAVNNGELLAI